MILVRKKGGAGYENELEEEVKCRAWMAWKRKLNITWLSRSEPLKVAQSRSNSVWLLSQSHFISLAVGAEP